MSVSNRKSLKELIHNIHDYLRNNGVGYGMEALKVFNLLYGLKIIEDKKIIEKFKLSNKCKFSELLKLAESNDTEMLTSQILEEVLDEIYSIDGIREFLFYEIPKNISSNVMSFLVKELNKIDESYKVNLAGKIYEYFLGRDKATISELGAYYTNRYIINYIMKKIKPSLTSKNKVKTICDPFVGSGGFLIGYIQYIIQKNKDIKINWDEEINKLYGFDMYEDVIKSTALELFCLSESIPNMKENFKCQNTFQSEFNDLKFDYIFSNPPYGGCLSKKSSKMLKRDKIIKHLQMLIKNIDVEQKKNIALKEIHKKQILKLQKENRLEKKELDKKKVTIPNCSKRLRDYVETYIKTFKKKYTLPANDKESCSLLLFMELLERNGLCAVVIKEGLLFNAKYKKIRKMLLENFNVKTIISLPSNQFENTNIKTSVLIFKNIETKTENVDFYEMIVNKYEEDKFLLTEENQIVLIENKGDIINITDKHINTVDIETITKKNFILQCEKYKIRRKLLPNKGYKIVKMKDICQFLPKSKRKASEGKNDGKYNFYTSSDKVKKINIADYNHSENLLIFGTGGNVNIHIDNNFSCSGDNFIIEILNYVEPEYIYFYLKGNKILQNGYNGSIIKHISKEYINNMEIIIPEEKELIDDWTVKFKNILEKIKNYKKKYNNLTDKLLKYVKKISNKENICKEYKLGDICQFLPKIKRRKSDIKNIINGKYNFYTSSNKIIRSNFLDYNFNYNVLIIGRSGSVNIHIDNKFSCSNEHNYILSLLTNNVNEYLYYYFINNINILQNGFNGSLVKNINIKFLKNIIVKIPENEKFLIKIKNAHEKLMGFKNELEKSENEFNELIKKLQDEAVSKDNIIEPIVETNGGVKKKKKQKAKKNKEVVIKKKIKHKKNKIIMDEQEEIITSKKENDDINEDIINYVPISTDKETWTKVQIRYGYNNKNPKEIYCGCMDKVLEKAQKWGGHIRSKTHANWVKNLINKT
jgi:type I restriction-modification system DNA methylase subunit